MICSVDDEIRNNKPKTKDFSNKKAIKNDVLIEWIVTPNASFSINRIFKLTFVKSIKVMKTFDDIMSLLPSLKPTLGQVLIVNDLHKWGIEYHIQKRTIHLWRPHGRRGEGEGVWNLQCVCWFYFFKTIVLLFIFVNGGGKWEKVTKLVILLGTS